jgi:hypothetical protein
VFCLPLTLSNFLLVLLSSSPTPLLRKELGARRLVKSARGDCSKDVEVQFVRWCKEELWPAIQNGENKVSSGAIMKWDDLVNDKEGMLRPVVKPGAFGGYPTFFFFLFFTIPNFDGFFLFSLLFFFQSKIMCR